MYAPPRIRTFNAPHFPFAPFAAALVCILAGPAHARADTILLDQSQLVVDGVAAINECCAFVAQTYTAGINGLLAAVKIDVTTSDQPSRFRLHVAIRGVTDGLPDARILGETTLGGPESPRGELVRFPQRIAQVAGSPYAIVVNYAGAPPAGAGMQQGGWALAVDNPYRNGSALVSETGASWFVSGTHPDLLFQTFVQPVATVPEPSTLLLVCAGACALGARRRLRSHG